MEIQLVSIVIVDDDLRFRQGLRTVLDFYSDREEFRFQIVGEAASVEQALKVIREQHPALVLLDLELGNSDGIAALNRLQEQGFQGKVLILSAHHEDEIVFRAMQAGARGYLFKERLAKQLYEAIATILKDEIYLAPEVATGFFRIFHFYKGYSLSGSPTIHLTQREREVLQWLVKGASNEEIAGHLYVTVATVKAHLTAIFEKLGVKSRTQAIVKALKGGLVSSS
ncbi:response regulator transcription factor [Phormidium sp. CCY1219]|uniref:response regulator transcription factor n=1 Tax=Phormidium sp. CCY1219 TaxID=2886104 RepID=UPI002D1F911F|nr:response regulator transcription factor [Phormidium sp. CCY1219]MEB3828422.1 response regulator transcription factor [Phormidium sp. CCY1219]